MTGSSQSQKAGRTTRPALRLDLDRTVHAANRLNPFEHVELVRYDRQGRWYIERLAGDQGSRDSRTRMKTVQDAVQAALEIEAEGGEIFLDRSGGGHFDYAVRAAKEKRRGDDDRQR